MAVSDPTKALMLLGERGVLALETEVLMIETENHPGVLGQIADRLAGADVNIEYAYMAATLNSTKGLMILRPEDVKKAQNVLQVLCRVPRVDEIRDALHAAINYRPADTPSAAVEIVTAVAKAADPHRKSADRPIVHGLQEHPVGPERGGFSSQIGNRLIERAAIGKKPGRSR